MTGSRLSRRAVMGGLAASAPLVSTGCLQARDVAPAAAAAPAGAMSPLPFPVTFIEHMGTVVPDVEAAVTFHSRLFNPAIMREENPPLRAYVEINPGYLAFGARPNEPRVFFDHFCVVMEDFEPDAVAARLEADGFDVNPAFMLYQDPDAIGVQLYRHPGGWFPTVVPAEPFVQGPPLVSPQGLEHVMLHVSDVDASVGFYRRYFGDIDVRPSDDLAWFELPDTRLGLRRAPAGQDPVIDHIRVRVAPFDHAALAAELTAMGARVAPQTEDGVLAFTDPAGLKLELASV